MNAFKTLFLSALLVSTGVLADSSTHTGSLKNQASQQAEKISNRAEEAAHKAEHRIEAENRLRNGGEVSTTDKVKEDAQKAWNRTKETTEKAWNRTKEAAQQAGDAVSEKVSE